MQTQDESRARTVDALSEALAETLRTGDVRDVFTEDVFLDGHPPFWRFQIDGLDAFVSWLRGYAEPGSEVTVVRTLPTESGFVAEHTARVTHGDEVITSRKVLVCEVRDGRVGALTVYCSGDWDAELRARHAAEAPILRPDAAIR